MQSFVIPALMGIVNVTPDSFSDGGLFVDADAALDHIRVLRNEGADYVDIGAESTRPGAIPLSAEDERMRLLPLLKKIKNAETDGVQLSIDTYKSATARLALEHGFHVVNDIWGLQYDPDMASVVADFSASAIIMHNRREKNETLDIKDDMIRFFEKSLNAAMKNRIVSDKIILDIGIGFGKTQEQNLQAIRLIPEFKKLGFPVLAGASRKSLIDHYLNRSDPRDRLFGTLGVHFSSIFLQADMLRVHDVRAHKDMCILADKIFNGV